MNFCRGCRKDRTGRTAGTNRPQSKAWRGFQENRKNALRPNRDRTKCGNTETKNLTFTLKKILINQWVRFSVRSGAVFKRTDFAEVSA